MSAESIARWKAIPFDRPEQPVAQPSLKRSRGNGDEDDESEDNVSLVSRSPSPPPDAMDVDKYDEYYRNKAEPEVVTVETKIKSSNIGFSMLAKMGWVEGSPLGLSGDGRVEPIPFYVKNDLTGLGKTNQDVRMIESTVSQRRELDSERQTKETEEQRKQREDAVAKRTAVQTEISTVLRPFYCEVCEKQFQNVAQYDEHTNSYAHHHKVRFRDMQAAQRASRNTDEEVSKRKEKERKREEKELRKLAKAAGVKMAKPPVVLAPPTASASAASSETAGSVGLKKSGWATVSAPAEPNKRSGWASVGEAQPASSNRGGWAAVSSSPPAPSTSTASSSSGPPPPPRSQNTGAPAFRTGGWTSLETSISVPPLPVAPSAAPPPPPSSSPPQSSAGGGGRQGWASMSGSPSSSGGWRTVPPTGPPPAGTAVPLTPTPSLPSRPPPVPARQETSRSGWQKFRAGAPGRR